MGHDRADGDDDPIAGEISSRPEGPIGIFGSGGGGGIGNGVGVGVGRPVKPRQGD